MTKLQKILLTLSMMILIAFIGCASIQDVVTPVFIPKEVIKYSGADIPRIMPYTTLADAKYVDMKTDLTYTMKKLEYGFYKNINALTIASGKEFKNVVFSPTGPVGALIPALSGLGIGSFLISKPSDKKKIGELEKIK